MVKTKNNNDAIINAAFNPETRARIANIAKVSEQSPSATTSPPPSLMNEVVGGSNKERHPLLSLHQSVGRSNNKNNNVNSEGSSENNQSSPLQQQQTEKLMKKINLDTKKSPQQTKAKPEIRNVIGDSTKANKLAAFISTLFMIIAISTLIILCILFMYSFVVTNKELSVEESVYKTISDMSVMWSAAHAGILSFVHELNVDIKSVKLLPSLSSTSSIFSYTKKLPLDQFEKRVEVGNNLLRSYGDATGSEASCQSVLNAITSDSSRGRKDKNKVGSLHSQVTSLMSVLTASENRVLSQALLCVGEAQLAMFSDSSFGSSTVVKKRQLKKAKESFEASIAIDPTNPSIRSGIGLSYLLLGVMKYDANTGNDDDDSNPTHIQYILQSIQHLKATIALTSNNEFEDSSPDEKIKIDIRNAAMHNLGLAYMALDRDSVEGKKGGMTTHFSDWVSSLRSDSTQDYTIVDSWIFAVNEATAMLQTGEIESAISTLEETAFEVCTGNDTNFVLLKRQKEACLIIQQNLAVAREDTRYGVERNKTGILYAQSLQEGMSTIMDAVTRWNADASSSDLVSSTVIAEVSTDVGSEPTLSIIDDSATEKTSSEKEEVLNDVAIDDDVEGESTYGNSLTSDNADTEESTHEKTKDPQEEEEEEEIIGLPKAGWGVKPQMQNALAMLEKAAEDGTPRTRMLLALARARSSSGDMPGAVDAAIKAVNAATSEGESESATLYLETLMDKLTGGSKEMEQDSTTTPEDHSTLKALHNTDSSISELEMKLELERLKYRVLEQDMKMQQMRMGSRYHETLQPFEDDSRNIRAIDYQQELDNMAQQSDIPRRPNDIDSEETVVETSKTDKKPIKLAGGDVMQKDTEQPLHTETETDVVINEKVESKTSEPLPDIENVVTNEVATDTIQSIENHPPPEDDTIINLDTTAITIEEEIQEEEIQEELPIQLPSLFSPELVPASEIS